MTFRLLKCVDNYQVEVLLTLAAAMGGYALASRLHVSGPLAMVVAGLMIGMGVLLVAFSATELVAAGVAILVTLLARVLTVGFPRDFAAEGLQPAARSLEGIDLRRSARRHFRGGSPCHCQSDRRETRLWA